MSPEERAALLKRLEAQAPRCPETWRETLIDIASVDLAFIQDVAIAAMLTLQAINSFKQKEAIR